MMRNENRNVSDPFGNQLPKGLNVDEVVTLGEHGAKVAVVQEHRNG
jgi:hypothetical protein